MLRPHRCRSSFTILFAPKHSFILPCLCVLRAFSEGLSVRELRTQSRNEEAQREVGQKLGGNFLVLRHESGPELFFWRHEGGHEFCHEINPNFFSLFSLPPKIQAKSMPLSGPKSTPILETLLSVVSLGARPWSASLRLDVNISMLTNKNL